MATVAVFNMIPIWNDLWFPLILAPVEETKTLTLGSQVFIGQFVTDWNAVPRFEAADRSSTIWRLSTSTSPVFSTVIVTGTVNVPSAFSVVAPNDLTVVSSGVVAGGVSGGHDRARSLHVVPVLLATPLAAPVAATVEQRDQVEVGQTICVLEAMKMKNVIRATRAGEIAAVKVTVGQHVQHGEVLIKFAE